MRQQNGAVKSVLNGQTLDQTARGPLETLVRLIDTLLLKARVLTDHMMAVKGK
jgi:hypothetical protein